MSRQHVRQKEYYAKKLHGLPYKKGAALISCEERPTLQTPPCLDWTLPSSQTDIRGYIQNQVS